MNFLLNLQFTLRNRFLRYYKRSYRQYLIFVNQFLNNFIKFKLYQILVLLLLIIFVILFYCIYYEIFESNKNDNVELLLNDQNIKQSNSDYHNSNHHRPSIEQHETNESWLGLINDEKDNEKKLNGFKLYSFNSLVSERLGYYRPYLPDTRHNYCHIHDDNDDDDASISTMNTTVIMCFYNEEFHTLIRTVNSILARTPEHLLAEILLIDDHSDNNLRSKYDEYRANKSIIFGDLFRRKVKYIRTPERCGLIRARNYAVQFAIGRILFFIDSHCEVNERWLQPILRRISNDSKIVACPIIDLIDPDTFIYKASPLVRGGFNWALHFKWDSVPNDDLITKEDFIRPIKSPAMAGGLFAIDREYFHHLGQYDSGMNIWGGENIEFSLRIWMCGGQLEIIPCSRVGHIFRKRRPYDSPDGQDTLAYNSLRLAHVWLDDYKKYFLKSRSDLSKMSFGNIDDRIKLRKRLNCKTFDWYLRNIYPNLLEQIDEKNKSSVLLLSSNQRKSNNSDNINLFKHKQPKILKKFHLQLLGTNSCLESESELSYKNSRLLLSECQKTNRRQLWKQTELNEIRIGMKGCLDTMNSMNKYHKIRINKCHQMGSTQKWSFTNINNNHGQGDNKAIQLYNDGSGMCLSVNLTNNQVLMSFCSNNNNNDSNMIVNHWLLI